MSLKSSKTEKHSVVLDTNVYLSAIVFGGTPRYVIKRSIQGKIQVYVSAEILLEVSNKLHEKFGWNQRQVESALQAIAKISTLVKPTSTLSVVKEDPTDNKIVECALEAKAQFIVTGDKHLLRLKRYKHIVIITPTQFIVQIGSA